MKFNQVRFLFVIFGILTTVVTLISGLVYFSTTNFIQEDYFKTIRIRSEIVAKLNLNTLQEDEKKSLTKVLAALSEKMENEADYIFLKTDSLNIPQIEKELILPHNIIKNALVQGSEQIHKNDKFYYVLIYKHNNAEHIIVTRAEHHNADNISAYMKKVSILAILFIFTFSIIAFFYLSKNIFSPIISITEKVKEISTENLHLRLELTNSSKEINELAVTFNDMINRLETSFETQNNFISNASHELRTPLTAIMGESEVCLSKERSVAEYQETIAVIMEEAEKLDKKTQALLMLAQTGFDGKAQKFEYVRIDELLWEVKATVDKIYNENQLVFDYKLLPDSPNKLKVNGNAQLLHLAFTNIILNACKYSNNDSVIISVGLSNDFIIVIIKDKGIGIPASELGYIYDPFFRASNTSKYKGYGIGLPLARNIIRMHKGHILVSSENEQGVTVEIKLPLAFK